MDRPSDAWAKHNSAPGYASFPSDIRHTKTRQELAKQGNTLKPTPDAFEEVQVGVLIGGSSSGNVYRGMWRSIPVSVKVHIPPPKCVELNLQELYFVSFVVLLTSLTDKL